MTIVNPRTKLRRLLERDEVAYLPGVHDAMSAHLAARREHVDAIQHSGYGTAASLLGLPDLDFVSLSETVDVVGNVVRAAGDTPVVVDGDTGYGGVANLRRTIPELERTGAASVFIEDQSTPKQCGLLADKDLIPPERMAGKVTAAREARDDEEFVIIARTDAYADHGVDAVVDRAAAYADAGADALLIGEVIDPDDLSVVCDRVDLPVYALAALTEHDGFDPAHPIDVYADAGAAMVSDVAALLQISVRRMEQYLDHVEETGDPGGARDDAIPLNCLSELLGVDDYRAFADRHRGDE